MGLEALFDPEPETWGLRGDPYVWRALRDRVSGQQAPATADEAIGVLRAAFRDVTGVDLANDPAPSIYREQFAHGGMSGGMISLDTWRDRLMPLLAERARTSRRP